MQAVLGGDYDSYRGFKYPWTGLPVRPPDLHAKAVWDGDDVLTIIHASWNGATEVWRWVFKTPGDDGDRHIGTMRRTGFETRFIYRGYMAYIFAQALDHMDSSLGKSEVVFTASPTAAGIDLPPRHTNVKSDGAVKRCMEDHIVEPGEVYLKVHPTHETHPADLLIEISPRRDGMQSTPMASPIESIVRALGIPRALFACILITAFVTASFGSAWKRFRCTPTWSFGKPKYGCLFLQEKQDLEGKEE